MEPGIEDKLYYVDSIFQPYYHDYYDNYMPSVTVPSDVTVIAYNCNGSTFATAEITSIPGDTSGVKIKWPDGLTTPGVYRYQEIRKGVLVCIGNLIVIDTKKCGVCH